MTAIDTHPPRAGVPMPVVWRFAGVAILSGFAALLLVPLAAVTLSARGYGPAAVGFFALLQPLTMLVLIPHLPRIQAITGRIFTVRAGLITGAAAAAGYVYLDAYAAWLAFSVLIGIQLAIHWTAVDTVISENAPKERAGAVIGLYQTLLAAAIAAAPFAAAQSGLSIDQLGRVAFVIYAISLFGAFGTVARLVDVASPQGPPPGLLRFLRKNRPLLATAILAGLFEVGTTTMGGVHALHIGFAAATAVIVASVIATGSLVAQVPIGKLADRFGAPLLMKLSAFVLLASALMLPVAEIHPWLLWPLAAIWGAFGGGLQTLVYMHVAVTRTGPQVQMGMVTMALGFTAGGLLGPAIGGVVMQSAPDLGFAAVLALMTVALLAILNRGV